MLGIRLDIKMIGSLFLRSSQSREKTVKNCVTNESTASKVSTDSDNRIETGKFSLSDHKTIKTLIVSVILKNRIKILIFKNKNTIDVVP